MTKMSDIKYITVPVLPVDEESCRQIDELLESAHRLASRRPLLHRSGKVLLDARDSALRQAFELAIGGWEDQQASPDPVSIEKARNAWSVALNRPLPDYVFSRTELRDLLLKALSESETPPRKSASDFVDAFIQKLSDE